MCWVWCDGERHFIYFLLYLFQRKPLTRDLSFPRTKKGQWVRAHAYRANQSTVLNCTYNVWSFPLLHRQPPSLLWLNWRFAFPRGSWFRSVYQFWRQGILQKLSEYMFFHWLFNQFFECRFSNLSFYLPSLYGIYINCKTIIIQVDG